MTENVVELMEPIVFNCDSKIRDFLLTFVNKARPQTQLRLLEYDSPQNREILIEATEDCLKAAEENNQDPWHNFLPEVQSYVNSCFDALDAKKEISDFPDKTEKKSGIDFSKRAHRTAKKDKTTGIKGRSKKVAPVEEPVKEKVDISTTEEKVAEKIPVEVPTVGLRHIIEGKDYLCLVETVSNYILENSIGDVITIAKEGAEKKEVTRKDPTKPVNGKVAGRKNITHLGTKIICENPDMSLEQICYLIRTEKHLAIGMETLRIKYTTIQEVRDWEVINCEE